MLRLRWPNVKRIVSLSDAGSPEFAPDIDDGAPCTASIEAPRLWDAVVIHQQRSEEHEQVDNRKRKQSTGGAPAVSSASGELQRQGN